MQNTRITGIKRWVSAASCLLLNACLDAPFDVNNQYRVRGSIMSDQRQAVNIVRNGLSVAGLKVLVNDQIIPQLSTVTAYVGSLTAPVPEGGRIALRIMVPEGAITANDSVPFTPTITPLTASLSSSQQIELGWTVQQSPDRYIFGVSTRNRNGVSQDIRLNGGSPYLKGTVLSVVLPVGSIPADTGITSIEFDITGINDGNETFDGPNVNQQDSLMHIQGRSSSASFPITP